MTPVRRPDPPWTREHDIALVAMAVAVGTDHDLDPSELALITDILPDWRHGMQPDEAQDVVMGAVEAFIGVDGDARIEESVATLAERLSRGERLRALEDMVRIAEVDGILLSSELQLIHDLAARWEVRSTAMELLEESVAARERNLLHDIAVVYVELGGGKEASALRRQAMVECLHNWRPDLPPGECAAEIEAAVESLRRAARQERLQSAVASVERRMRAMHRVLVLDDLLGISQSDGDTTQAEETFINGLAHAWGVCLRCDVRSADAGHSA